MATVYLDSASGSDSTGDGSSGNPYQTIAKGFTEVGSDGTVIMKASATTYAVATDTIPSNVTLKGDTYPQKIGEPIAILDFNTFRAQWTLTDTITVEDCMVFDMVDAASSWIYTKPATGDAAVTFNRVHFKDCQVYRSTGSRGGLVGGGASVSGFSYDSMVCTLNECILENVKGAASLNGLSFMVGGGTDTFNTVNCTIYNDSSGSDGLDYLATAGNSTNPIGNISHKNLRILHEHADAIDLGNASNETTDGLVYYTSGGAITQTANTTNSTNSESQFIDKANSVFYISKDDPTLLSGVAV